MLTGTPRHRSRLESSYDAIVIGSGIGGLTTAACLAKRGRKVLVLEQHYTAGGFTHSYLRKGYEWDVGVHYIGDVHRPHSVMRRLFDYVSDSNLRWAAMEPVYDRIYIGDESFDYIAGTANFRDKMLGYFPNEAEAIDGYLRQVAAVNRTSSWFYLEKALPRSVPRRLANAMRRPYLRIAEQTTAQVLAKLTSNKKLIAVLTGQWGDYGATPRESSFAMHAMVAKHYLGGAAYPIGGGSAIARHIIPVIARAGGQVITRAKVEQILVQGNRATGVQLQGGQQISAPTVVSAVGVLNTWQELLSPELQQRHGMQQRLQAVRPSMAHVGLYIGLKGTTAELGLNTTNLWLYQDHDHDDSVQRFMADTSREFPVVYISFPSSKDPEWPVHIVSCGVGGGLLAGMLTSLSILGPRQGLSLISLLRPRRPAPSKPVKN